MATGRKLEMPRTAYGELVTFIVRSSNIPRPEQDELLDSWFDEYRPEFFERGVR